MKWRMLIFVVVAGLGAIVAGWVYESSLRPKEKAAELEIPQDIDYFLTEVDLRAMNSLGEIDYLLQTPRMEHYPHNDVSNLDTPSMQIFATPDKWLIDSKQGRYQHAPNILHLSDDVVMVRQGQQPLQAYSERMRFEPDRERVTSETEILIVSPMGRIHAEHAIFDLDKQIHRFRNARTVYFNENS